MGNTNCKSCNCTQFFDKKIELDLKSTSVPSQAPAFDPKPKLSLSKSREKLNLEHLRPLIPKLQALWLGHTARNYVTHLKRQTRPNHNYFNRNEIMETLSSKVGLGKFRQKKKPYKYASGAVYTGEWLGGFRDGFGTMEWPDGAKYQGNWSYSKPFGYGTFTHVDGDTYDGDWKICFVSPKDTFGTASNLNRWKDMVSDGYCK
jgi:hypothetical protein